MRSHTRIRTARCVVCAAIAALLARAAMASDTQLVTFTIQGSANTGTSTPNSASCSADGRYVAFASSATNLVAGAIGAQGESCYLRDTVLGTTVRVGPAFLFSSGLSAKFPVLSSDGSTLVFESNAKLALSDTNNLIDVYAYSVATQAIECVTVDNAGVARGGRIYVEGRSPSPHVVSADGNFVAFQSTAAIDPLDGNGVGDIYVRDRSIAFTRLESVTATGSAGNGSSIAPELSASSDYVVFRTTATDLAGAVGAGVYRKDRLSGALQVANRDSQGLGFDGVIASNYALSADGRFLAMTVAGPNPNFGDSSAFSDIFVHDLALGIIEWVSRSGTGAAGNGDCSEPDISADGRYVSFVTEATNLVVGDKTIPGFQTVGADVVVHDRSTAQNALISVSDFLVQNPGTDVFSVPTCLDQSMSRDGRRFTIVTTQKLEPLYDTTTSQDVYLRDRLGFATILAGKAGQFGPIQLAASGSMAPGGNGTIQVSNARPNSAAFLFVGIGNASVQPTSGPLKGSVVVTLNPALILSLTTSGQGTFTLPYALPNLALPPALHLQTFVLDASVVGGVASSNGIEMAF